MHNIVYAISGHYPLTPYRHSTFSGCSKYWKRAQL